MLDNKGAITNPVGNVVAPLLCMIIGIECPSL